MIESLLSRFRRQDPPPAAQPKSEFRWQDWTPPQPQAQPGGPAYQAHPAAASETSQLGYVERMKREAAERAKREQEEQRRRMMEQLRRQEPTLPSPRPADQAAPPPSAAMRPMSPIGLQSDTSLTSTGTPELGASLPSAQTVPLLEPTPVREEAKAPQRDRGQELAPNSFAQPRIETSQSGNLGLPGPIDPLAPQNPIQAAGLPFQWTGDWREGWLVQNAMPLLQQTGEWLRRNDDKDISLFGITPGSSLPVEFLKAPGITGEGGLFSEGSVLPKWLSGEWKPSKGEGEAPLTVAGQGIQRVWDEANAPPQLGFEIAWEKNFPWLYDAYKGLMAGLQVPSEAMKGAETLNVSALNIPGIETTGEGVPAAGAAALVHDTYGILVADAQRRMREAEAAAGGQGLSPAETLSVMAENASALPRNLMGAWAIARDQMTEALTPTPEQAAFHTPDDLLRSYGIALGLGYQGTKDVGQLFDSLLDVPVEASRLRQEAQALLDQAAQLPEGGGEQTAIEMQAMMLGAEASKLENTHPFQLYNNLYNLESMVGEMILDPLNLVDFVFDVVGWSPKARRLATASEVRRFGRTELDEAIKVAEGVGHSAGKDIQDALRSIPVAGQTGTSKSRMEAKSIWEAFFQLTHTFETKEDALLLLKSLFLTPDLLRSGLPTASFTSGSAKWLDSGGVVRIPLTELAQYEVVKSLKNFWGDTPDDIVAGILGSMESLRTTGDLHKANFMDELWIMLHRGAAVGENVSKSTSPIPTAAKSARLGAGDVIEYLDSKGNVLHTTQPLPNALNELRIAQDTIKRGEHAVPYADNYPRIIGNLMRQANGVLTIHNPFGLGSFINDYLSNRGIALWDGTLGIGGKSKRLNWFTRQYDGAVPNEFIARHLDILKGEDVSTKAGRELAGIIGNIPGVRQVKEWRNWQENAVRADIITKTMFEEMAKGINGSLIPHLTSFLTQSGVDPQIAATWAKSLAATGMDKGRTAMVREFYDLANGIPQINVGAISQTALEIFDDGVIKQLDSILKTVTPQTLPDARQSLRKIMTDYLTSLGKEMDVYGPVVPTRQFFTRNDFRRETAQLGEMFKTIAKLNPDLGIDVAAEIRQLETVQNNISNAMKNLVRIQGTDATTPKYIWGLQRYIDEAMTAARATRDRLSTTALQVNTPQAWADFHKASRQLTADLSTDIMSTIEDTRQFLNSGAWRADPTAITSKGIGPMTMLDDQAAQAGTFVRWLNDVVDPNGNVEIDNMLRALGFDPEQALILHSRPLPSSKVSPRKTAAIEAGRKGVDQFRVQMAMMLQRFPTDDSFDIFRSAMDDAASFTRRHLDPVIGKWEAAIAKGKDAVNNLATQYRTTPTPALAKKLDKAKRDLATVFKNSAKETTEAWREYYEFVFSRYQSAAVEIAGQGLPRPTFQLGGQTVEIIGQDWRKKGLVIIKNAAGRYEKIEWKLIPPDALGAFTDRNRNFYELLADEVGKVAVGLFDEGTGIDEIDDLIKNVRGGGYKHIFDQVAAGVRSTVQGTDKLQGLPENVEKHVLSHSEHIFNQIYSALDNVANINVQTGRQMPLDVVGKFNDEVMPIFDGIRSSSLKYGNEMAVLANPDQTVEWGIDILLSLVAPYTFWATRQGKNILERIMTQPGKHARLIRAVRMMEIQSEQEMGNIPGRAVGGIPTGITAGDITGSPWGETAELVIPNLIRSWLPLLPQFIFGGYADVERSNAAYDYIAEAMRMSGYEGASLEPPGLRDWLAAGMPGGAKGLAGAVLMASEGAGSLGLGLYPWWDAALMGVAGLGDHLSIADIGIPGRLLGAGTLALTGQANWGQVRAAPSYAEAQAAKLLSEQAGRMSPQEIEAAQAVLQAQAQGRPVDPLFSAKFPTAAGTAQEAMQVVGGRDLVRSLLRIFLGGATPIVVDENEPLRRDAQQQYGRMGYSEENPYGSRARTGMYDPDSPLYNEQLAAAGGMYGVYDETGRSDLDMLYYDVYLPERNKIYATFEDEMAKLQAQMGPVTEQNRFAYAKADDPLYERRNASLAELREQMPDQANRQGKPSEMRGYSPDEAKRYVLESLERQAKAEWKDRYPQPGAPQSEWDAYNAGWQNRFKELANDRSAIQAAFGSYPYIEQAIDLDAFGPEVGTPVQPQAQPEPIPAPEPQRNLYGYERVQQEQAAQPLGTPVPATGTGAAQTPVSAALPSPSAATAVQPQAQATTAIPVTPGNNWSTSMQEQEQLYGLPPGILQALGMNESSFGPTAVSSAGAIGLLQVMPGTWNEIAKELGLDDPNDPEQSILAGAYYLNKVYRGLPEGKRTWDWALAAYNWGPGNVSKASGWGDVPEETRRYVKRIMDEVKGHEALSPQVAPAPAAVPSTVLFPFAGEQAQTQSYGVNPQRYTSWGGHMGIDWSMPEGTPLLAVQDSTVLAIGYNPGSGNKVPGLQEYRQGEWAYGTGGFGQYVIVQHADGTFGEYGHLSEIGVKPGQKIKAGGQVGLSGHTGVSDFPHLHYGMRDADGNYVDPLLYLGKNSPIAQNPPVSQEEANRGIAIQQEQPVSDSPWGVDLDEFLERDFDPDAPSAVYRQQRDAVWANIDQRRQAAYPEYEDLYQRYQAAGDRDAFADQNPEIRAVNLINNNPEGWEYITQAWGEDAALLYALTPKSEYYGGEKGARSKYYQQYPDAFLIRSWLVGRPTGDDREEGAEWTWNNGADYREAERLFGKDIWAAVREAQTVPDYVPGDKATGQAWGEFHDRYPRYSEWSEWWWGNLSGGSGTSGGSGSRGGYQARSDFRPWQPWASYGRRGGSSGRTRYNPQIRYQGGTKVSVELAPAPKWSGGSSGSGAGWRRWISEGESLRNWRGR